MNKYKAKDKVLQAWKSENKNSISWQKVWLGFHSTGPFKAIWGQQSHPGRALKLSQSFARLGASRNTSYNSYGSPTFSKLITVIPALLAHLIDIFVIFDMFASWLNSLIEVLTYICAIAIARVFTFLLGFLSTGEISLNKGCHRVREVKTNWLMYS